MLIHSASQLICLRGGAQRGAHLGELDIIPDGAVLLQGDTITQVGTSADLLRRFPHETRLDAHQQVVMPGFVDPHTHLIWAGDRADEFTQRLEGKSYMEIMAAGGGINATVRATRQASSSDLKAATSSRARAALRHGTTTLEAKLESLRRHKSQYVKYGDAWIRAVQSRCSFRGYEAGVEQAEAFEVVRIRCTP